MRSLLFCISLFVTTTALSQLRLPRLISDNMVLQRDTRLRIWGWTAPGKAVHIQFNGKRAVAKAGADGRWNAMLAPMKAGGPYNMMIESGNTITLKDIMIGDVWICSGQSNMVHQMELHGVTYAEDIEKANYPQIRHFWIPTMTDVKAPHDDLPAGNWNTANPTNVRSFSAVAYFFARKTFEKYRVPIGLINASVGGTPIEAWINEEGLKNFPEILAKKDTVTRAAPPVASKPVQDKGLTAAIPWYDTAYQPKGWRRIAIPGYWEDQGVKDLNGVVWYRKEIEVPASMAGKPARIFLGRIVDADALYINGKQVGTTTYMYPQRRYTVPAGLLKAGKNLFVIRVTNNAGKGGFVPDKPYCLFAGNDTVDLKGYWNYKVGEVFIPWPFQPGFSAQNQPSALFNAMLAPVVNYNIKGFLWYQGEANTNRARQYAQLQPALINAWRKLWQGNNLPFIFVQLPGFMDMTYLPVESQWAEFREAQASSLSVPNTAMAIAIDLGEWNDIHPDNKKSVGERVALAAWKLAYGEKDIVYSGPLLKNSIIDGNKIVLSFDHTGSGLIAIDGEELTQFAIAGTDKKFVWAQARIEGDKVIVWSDDLAQPAYVRYAWADNPAGANLYNKEGLPAAPFRTDR